MSTILRVESLGSGYGELPVLDGITLEVGSGEIVSVVGANGAGKTTLLLTIGGHLRARSGRVVFDGHDITRLPAHAAAERGLVMVPEGGRLFPFMTVLENLELGAYHRSARARQQESLDEVMRLFPILAERRTQLAGRLSGGERQMCAVARALMARPKLLMLDEPSLGLAPIIVDQVMDVITRLRAQGCAIVLVEQLVERALEVADKAYVLQTGRIIGSGTPAEIHGSDLIKHAYLGV